MRRIAVDSVGPLRGERGRELAPDAGARRQGRHLDRVPDHAAACAAVATRTVLFTPNSG